MRRRTTLRLLVAAGLCALAAPALPSCGASGGSSADRAGGSCYTLECNPPDAGLDQIVADVPFIDAPPPPADAGLTWNPLCGAQCLPDFVAACQGWGGAGGGGGADSGDASADGYLTGGTGGGAATGAGGAAGAGGGAGGDPDGGPQPDAGGDGSASDGSGDASEGGLWHAPFGFGPEGGSTATPDTGASPEEAEAGAPLPGYGCHVRREKGNPVARCEPAGPGSSGAPCTSSADCQPALGCVGGANAGECRRFCCTGADPTLEADAGAVGCETGTWCDERPLRDDAIGATALSVPVCVPADDCSLAEPYPCPVGQNCKCAEGTACTVVRKDGTTTCMPPGNGGAGDACPCAWGYVCSQATGKCLELCTTGNGGTSCEKGACQDGDGLPDGWGVCVGAGKDGG